MSKPIANKRLQIDLFPTQTVTPTLGPLLDYEPVHVSSSTFLSGLSQNIHRWFRLTPSFGPDLVRAMIDEMRLEPTAHVHDPFSGAGTTAIESSLEAYENSCVEINPFLHFVNKVCLEWSIDSDLAAKTLLQIEKTYIAFRAKTTLATITDIGVEIPPIHNVNRWWREDVLLDILCIKAAINRIDDVRYKDFFRLALAAVLVPDLTNVTLGRLQLHFIDKSKHVMNAWIAFQSHATVMIGDLSALNERKLLARTKLIYGDSTSEATYENISSIDAVITSPPYPNRYSYVWNTRPHLYMLDFVKEAKTASQIDKKTIGGTWGTATSELMKGVVLPRNEVVKEALQGLDDKIRLKDNLMANYVVHYFNRLDLHLSKVGDHLSSSGQLAYVVGNSWIKEEYIDTDLILGRLMEGTLGMRLKKIHRFRRRHSGINLYESIVYAKK